MCDQADKNCESCTDARRDCCDFCIDVVIDALCCHPSAGCPALSSVWWTILTVSLLVPGIVLMAVSIRNPGLGLLIAGCAMVFVGFVVAVAACIPWHKVTCPACMEGDCSCCCEKQSPPRLSLNRSPEQPTQPPKTNLSKAAARLGTSSDSSSDVV